MNRFEAPKATIYLTLAGELWGVFCKDFEENWSRYNGTVLYSINQERIMVFSIQSFVYVLPSPLYRIFNIEFYYTAL